MLKQMPRNAWKVQNQKKGPSRWGYRFLLLLSYASLAAVIAAIALHG